MRCTTLARFALAVFAVSSLGCLPRERLNKSCHWVGDSATLAPPGDPSRAAHLAQDMRVAEQLGVAYGDSVSWRVGSGRQRQRCIEQTIAEIMRRHSVSRAEIDAVTGVRDLWVDLLAVFVPVAIILAVAGRLVVRRILAGYDGARGMAIAVLVVIAPIAGALAVGMSQMWSTTVESMRVHSGHISFRMFRLPAYAHGRIVWAIATVLFAAVAASTFAKRSAQPVRR